MDKRMRRDVSAAEKSEMPGFIKPQFATLKSKAPVGPQWLHEIKFDASAGCVKTTPSSYGTRGAVSAAPGCLASVKGSDVDRSVNLLLWRSCALQRSRGGCARASVADMERR
jgi:hypothetical protein